MRLIEAEEVIALFTVYLYLKLVQMVKGSVP